MPDRFILEGNLTPQADQQQAIDALRDGIERNERHQCLLGVTGSGKTFTIAKVIEAVNRPTLIMAHNKTLAAQLYTEFREFFPHNAVEYFVSYYDYYQPEAYIPSTDTYIEKDAKINEEIDMLRHRATRALFERRDVIVVASVSCIYGLGSPESYHQMSVVLERGMTFPRRKLLRRLVEIQYRRNDLVIERGCFRVRGDIVDIQCAGEDVATRVELFGDEIESLALIDPLRPEMRDETDRVVIYPRSHYVTPEVMRQRAIRTIGEELEERLAELRSDGKLVEAQRLEQRTTFDLEMLREAGHCQGIENYSRHLTGRSQGAPPPTLIEYLPQDAIVVTDESHQTIPQIRGMYRGDRSRKMTLVEHGFRLKSALDNRPLTFEEWEAAVSRLIFVSATPGPYELERTGGAIVEQLVRPTGLLDPVIHVRPVAGQVDDLLEAIRARVEKGERVLVTTLTKRMAEELTNYYQDLDIRVRYLHSDIKTLERMEILQELRAGAFDVLVGINLLREGLDLPEVSLVAVLDADKEGFLRSTTSLVQTVGRAARNRNGEVILYADKRTDSIKRTLEETARRRAVQTRFNQEHGITPRTIIKRLQSPMGIICEKDHVAPPRRKAPNERIDEIPDLKRRMRAAAAALDFEEAARLRDRIRSLSEEALIF